MSTAVAQSKIRLVTVERLPPKPPLWRRLLHNLHIYAMPESEAPTKYWNTTMVTTWCAVISLIIVLLGFVCTGAFALGVMYSRMETMNERLLKAEDDASKAKMLEATKAGKDAGH